MKDSAYYISKLALKNHPEGGYYNEVYSSSALIKKDCLPSFFPAERKYYTSIYFLLEGNQVSLFHKIKSDEIWYFHLGSSLTIHVIDNDGNYIQKKLGLDFENGNFPQQMVKAGCWFGASVNKQNDFCLAGCLVSPGFHFDDFELADRNELLKQYPKHTNVINKFTKPSPSVSLS